jgi:hypothetical protein
LAKEHGYRAVRFNPYLWPDGEKMTNEVKVTGRATCRESLLAAAPTTYLQLRHWN